MLWNTHLVRLLITALLLVGAPGAFKVVCVSSTGHDTIEDWAALCCVRGAGSSGSSLSEPTPCQGCTDYPVTPTIGINSTQSESSRLVTFANSAFAVITPSRLNQETAIASAISLDLLQHPTFSPRPTTSLRC